MYILLHISAYYMLVACLWLYYIIILFVCIFNNALDGWVAKRKVLKKWVVIKKKVWEALTGLKINISGHQGLLKITFLYILAHQAKIYWNLILKSPGIFLIGANLAQF